MIVYFALLLTASVFATSACPFLDYGKLLYIQKVSGVRLPGTLQELSSFDYSDTSVKVKLDAPSNKEDYYCFLVLANLMLLIHLAVSTLLSKPDV